MNKNIYKSVYFIKKRKKNFFFSFLLLLNNIQLNIILRLIFNINKIDKFNDIHIVLLKQKT